MNTADVVANTIAGLALLVSCISIFISYKTSRNDSIHTLQSRYYEKIFDDYLITKLPKARERITYANRKIDGADALIDELDNMKSAALYFKYSNNDFYKELTDMIDDTTKYISNACNLKDIDQDKQSDITKQTKEYMTKIYQIIYKNDTGSKNN